MFGGTRTAEEMATLRNQVAALFAVFAAIAGVVTVLKGPVWLRVVLAPIAVVGAVVVLALHLLERRLRRLAEIANRAERRRALIDQLSATTADPKRPLPTVQELSPYDLGADPEAVLPPALEGSDPRAYLPRDQDAQLCSATLEAVQSLEPSMVILRGPSKAGKSRTLFEVISRIPELNVAWVLAPRDAEALTRLTGPDGLPQMVFGITILWLDDLEVFVTGGEIGMHVGLLDRLAAWPTAVVIVATAGGRAPEGTLASGMSVAIERLYRDRRVRVVAMGSELSPSEMAHVRARFARATADRMLAHGIGEYFVAAPELARKLEEERHSVTDSPCPEGAAVAWATIDWARSGMVNPISRTFLRELWALYRRSGEPTEEVFSRGLDWALRAPYRSIALVEPTANGYSAYDWIVTHADQELHRDINPEAWDRIIDTADPDPALGVGVAAYARGDLRRGARALRSAELSTDPRIAATAALNRGIVLRGLGDTRGAEAEFRQAIERTAVVPRVEQDLGRVAAEHGAISFSAQHVDWGSLEIAPRATLNLGTVLVELDDPVGAAEAFWETIESGHPDHAPMAAVQLGNLLQEAGDSSGAMAAYRVAITSGNRIAADAAAEAIGALPEARAARADRADALRRAVGSGSPLDIAVAAIEFGNLLVSYGDMAGARAAYEQAMVAGDANASPDAAVRLGDLLVFCDDTEGARIAYEIAIESGHPEHARDAADKLGDMLSRQGDVEGAAAAYRFVIESGDRELAGPAAYGLGILLANHGDPVGGARGARAGDPVRCRDHCSRRMAQARGVATAAG
jgi:tetratricopeptide (TPR) repeat protein